MDSETRAEVGQEPASSESGGDGGEQEAMETQPPPDPRVSRIVVSANGVSSYHGRTSALYEDSVPERQPPGDVQQPRMPDDWVERGLVAEAARQSMSVDQRQQETPRLTIYRSDGRAQLPQRKARL